MSPQQARTILVLGGIRSGKSEFAESLVAGAPSVRYVATATLDGDTGTLDTEWAARIAAHRARRPAGWLTEETGKAPGDLAALISSAPNGDTLLVDDIGGWLTAILDQTMPSGADTRADDSETAARGFSRDGGVIPGELISALAGAVAGSAARVVIVSPEVGLSVIPATTAGRAFADACGTANRALATVCEAVALVVAGQPAWIKPDAAGVVGTPGRGHSAAPALLETTVVPAVATARPGPVPALDPDFGSARDGDMPVFVGMPLPVPDGAASAAAASRVASLPVPGPGLGVLAPVAALAAGAAQTEHPGAFRSPRVLLVTGDFEGVLGSGAAEVAARLDAARDGSSALVELATEAGMAVEIIVAGPAGAVEDGDASGQDEIDAALWQGWLVANACADRGDDLIVLAADGAGPDAAAAGVLSGITRIEIPTLLGRVFRADGTIDDAAWMDRCVAIRDALLRRRGEPGDGPALLRTVGGPVIATAAGIILGAASRRTPVLLDGPIGVAAAVVARDYATESRLWCVITDNGAHPATRAGADLLGLEPLVDLRMGAGEGTVSVSLLPLIQSSLRLVAHV